MWNFRGKKNPCILHFPAFGTFPVKTKISITSSPYNCFLIDAAKLSYTTSKNFYKKVTISRQSNSEDGQEDKSKSISDITGENLGEGPGEYVSLGAHLMLPCHQSVQHPSEDVGEQCCSSELMDNLSKHRAGQQFEPSPPAKDYVPTIANSPRRSNASPLDADHAL